MHGHTHSFARLACSVALLVALPAFAEEPQARATQSWDDIAQAALTGVLHETWPAVTQWGIQPLIGRRLGDRLRGDTATSARVLRIGARSAVALRWSNRPGETTVWYAVRGEQGVLAVNRDVAPLRSLLPADATLATRDVMSLGCKPLSEAAMLDGMRARTPLRAGDAVCATDVEPQPAVGRGERVTVHSQAGRVRVTATAIAEEDGAVGDLLKLRAPASRATYFARVSGRGEVRIDE